jgi:hypothetical protein
MAGSVTPNSVQEYVAKGSPVFPFTLKDDSGAPVNLTGATLSAYMYALSNGAVAKMFGTFTLANQTTNPGQANYQWTLIDLNVPGGFYVYISAKLPAEPYQREFQPVTLIVLPTPEYLGGLYVQEVDLNVNGQPASNTNPVPVDVIDRIARVLGTVIISSMPGISDAAGAISTSNPLPTTSGQVGLIAPLGTNPAATGIGADTQFKWTGNATVQRVIISNETGADVRYELDATATANSLRLKDGNVLFIQQPCTVLHLFTAAAQTINQAGGVMVRGYN